MESKMLLKLSVLLIVFNYCASLIIKPRSTWGAEPPTSIKRILGPVRYVIIHHSNADGCRSSARCKQLIRNIQSEHMDRPYFTDIGYNFIIAGDGKVYEGRGFGRVGSHATNYNSNSIGIAFLGDFEDELPSSRMLGNAKALIVKAVSEGYLKNDYTLIGHTQTKATSCPGDALYEEIQTWPHWKRI